MKKLLIAIPVMMLIGIANTNAQSAKKQPSSPQTADRQSTTTVKKISADKPRPSDGSTSVNNSNQQAAKPASAPTPASRVGTGVNSDGTARHAPAYSR